MIYSQDALWWRLKNPHVRALASVLTAPPLWQTGCELPVKALLGEQGFRLLLEWDDNPDFRLPENVFAPRLGIFAENLLAYWFQHAPHAELLAQNLPIVQPETGETLGALDFVVELAGCVYHVELCCKYFGGADGQPENMVGLNAEDTLLAKYRKLPLQLALSSYKTEIEKRVSVVRGMGFSHSGSLKADDIFAVNAWNGVLIDDVAQWQQFVEENRFYELPRLEWLAPARVDFAQTVDLAALSGSLKTGLFAQVVRRPDGFWHEIGRVMVREF
ncbi:DUF1853 family protein [Kingella negevensis]|uniref:DUF1853 family protein n=1 Tax=Kingella negevensis TaxID=1522312 RepID=UPI0025439C38|nr:DUF1853 family protein [Kingella negevensis]WII93412.1 DUF1853 family protein [Kingella negevensis]